MFPGRFLKAFFKQAKHVIKKDLVIKIKITKSIIINIVICTLDAAEELN
jgi:hypothetical protein